MLPEHIERTLALGSGASGQLGKALELLLSVRSFSVILHNSCLTEISLAVPVYYRPRHRCGRLV